VGTIKILILGATGRVGGYVLNYLMQDNQETTVLVRQPHKLVKQKGLNIIQGNVLHKDHLECAFSFGVDVVISALSTDKSTTLSMSMPIILNEMKKHNIRRIITVGTSGVLQSRSEPDLLRYCSNESKRTSTWASVEHHKIYNLFCETDFDWTIVCPPYLANGNFTGSYRIERRYLPLGGVSISIPDVAHCVCKQIDSAEYLKTRIGIAY